MNLIDTSTWTTSFILASIFWGAVGSGYLIYGWKQKSMVPFVVGVIMSVAACFVPAFPMTLICILSISGGWWMHSRGY